MKIYCHLSLEEREKLYALREQRLSHREIAKILRRSQSSISRELKRNKKCGRVSMDTEYIPCKAQALADKRKVIQRTKAPLKDLFIFSYVRRHLKPPYCWSPEQIGGRLALKHPGRHITKETIYRYIDGRGRRFKLQQYLTLKRKRRIKTGGRQVQRVGKIPGSISIDLRPREVEARKELGHWESDNVVGRQTDKTVLSVTVERVLHVTLIDKMRNKTSDEKTRLLVRRLTKYPEHLRQTLTVDNGAENSRHQKITDSLNMLVFFCHAYHSWEKGTVENTNGILRRYIPKGMSIDAISDETIKAIENKMNNTPRKCLGFMTPYEKLREALKV